mgnify:CR=1 FL=1
MIEEEKKDCSLKIRQELSKKGFFSGFLPASLNSFITLSVFNDIIKKINSFKKINTNNSNDLEKILINNLSKLTHEEIDTFFGPISNRYLPPQTVAFEVSQYLKSHFKSKYNINLFLHGIRRSDRQKLLPSVEESSTIAIWYRVYPPNSKCGLPHRDLDFWKIDEVANEPIDDATRIKFWMPIYGCNKKNSLRLWPGSHKLKIKSEFTSTDKRLVPFINQDQLTKCGEYVCPSYDKGQFVLFADRTIHQGPPNINSRKDGYRISLETTLFVNSNII